MAQLAVLAVLASGWLTPTQESEISGRAKIHNLIPEVAANRGMSLSGHVGGVALMRRGDLGRTVWVDVGGGWTGPWLVVDVADAAHFDRRVGQRDVVELPRDAWLAWGLPLAPVPARVRFQKAEPTLPPEAPAPLSPVPPARWRDVSVCFHSNVCVR